MMCSDTITEQRTLVKYDPSTQMWQAINGRVWSFPGPLGRPQAELYALEHDAPEVAEEVKAIIANAESLRLEMFDAEAITSRAIRAGFLIRDGKVLPPVPFDQYGSYLNEIARVQGSQPEPYIVNQDGEECYCDCPDYQLEHAPVLPSGQRACKHILAVLITEALQLAAEDELADIDQPITLPPCYSEYAAQAELT